MTNPIELAARTAKAGITGVTATGDKGTQQNARGGELIRSMAQGGLALGAGTGALVALVNYLKSMREESEIEDENRLNDDTLYIPGIKKSADVNRWVAPGIAATGGILSAGAAYTLTQSVYNYLQKKRRQAMLDEAQGEALLASDEEIAKAAATGARMDFYDLATAFPVAIPLLAAMASGGVAYAALKKTFPTVKSPKSRFPRRVRQVSGNGQVEDLPEDVDDQIKSAADHAAEDDLEDAALEFLMLTVDQLAREKSAKHRLTSEVLNRVAKDGLASVVELQKEGGLMALTMGVKGAADVPADLPNRVLAAAAICKSARLRPVMAALSAAELQELTPDLYATTVSYGEEQMDKFAGVAPLLHLTYFRPLMLEKAAASNPLMEELMQLLLAGGETTAGVGTEEQGGMEAALTSDVNGTGAVDAEGTTSTDNPDVDDDPVDQVLTDGGNSSAIIQPLEGGDEGETVPL